MRGGGVGGQVRIKNGIAQSKIKTVDAFTSLLGSWDTQFLANMYPIAFI